MDPIVAAAVRRTVRRRTGFVIGIVFSAVR
jgi:hypothetical protein